MINQNLQLINAPGRYPYPQMKLAALLNGCLAHGVDITDEVINNIAELSQTDEMSVRRIISYYPQFRSENDAGGADCECLPCYLNDGERAARQSNDIAGKPVKELAY